MPNNLLTKPVEPDFEALRNNILRKGTPTRVHYMELYQDNEIKDAVVARYDLENKLDKNDKYYRYQREVLIQKFLGYDIVCGALEPPVIYPNFITAPKSQDTTAIINQNRGERIWANEHQGPIQTWEDFEKYQWPDVNKLDLSSLDWANKNLEPNMKVYLPTHSIYELGSALFGYEQLCYKMYDEPELVDAVFAKVGENRLKLAEVYCDYDCVGMLFGGDDMGFKTGLLMPKQFLLEKVLPWYKKMAEVAHNKNKLIILHSCGNIEPLMDSLINEVKLDGRHSFEDVITPVTEAKRLYGNRIAIIGGIDMNFICTATESEIRKRVRQTLDICQPGGGYCLGTGNTVANYIPLENYLIMLDEGRKYTS
ncbi:MAG: uroporphyrinogen-III decarboxylase-like protein [bacterium]|nr:uroporphyrinogen-III decarboxylase-like protein [bacterium]